MAKSFDFPRRVERGCNEEGRDRKGRVVRGSIRQQPPRDINVLAVSWLPMFINQDGAALQVLQQLQQPYMDEGVWGTVTKVVVFVMPLFKLLLLLF